MGMSIEELIKRSDYHYFIVADGCIWESIGYSSDICCGDKVMELHDLINTMRKYQKIEQIVKGMKDSKSDIVGLNRHNTEYYMNMIERALEDGNDD